LSDISGEPIFAFCAIGNPDSFVKMLTKLGAKICGTIFFRDHFHYDTSTMKEIEKKSLLLGAKWIVTTQKDAVKIASLSVADLNIFALQIDLVFHESSSAWERMLLPDQSKGTRHET
jgi:tetraacyldisaccharide 4'-kinase